MDKLEQKIVISNLKNLSSIYYTGSQKNTLCCGGNPVILMYFESLNTNLIK